MKNKPRMRKEVVLFAGGLILTGEILALLTPNTLSGSPWVVYQNGLVEIIAGVMGLIGFLILFVEGIAAWFRKTKAPANCPTCGTPVGRTTDRFCRACGASLLTK